MITIVSKVAKLTSSLSV